MVDDDNAAPPASAATDNVVKRGSLELPDDLLRIKPYVTRRICTLVIGGVGYGGMGGLSRSLV